MRAERKAEDRLRRKGELEATREREQQKEERSYDRIMGVRPLLQCTILTNSCPDARATGGAHGVQPRGGGEVRERGGGGG